jgi:hypothetical protein
LEALPVSFENFVLENVFENAYPFLEGLDK